MAQLQPVILQGKLTLEGDEPASIAPITLEQALKIERVHGHNVHSAPQLEYLRRILYDPDQGFWMYAVIICDDNNVILDMKLLW